MQRLYRLTMGLRRRLRLEWTTVPAVPDPLYGDPRFGNLTSAQRLSYEARSLAGAARWDIVTHGGALEDIQSTMEALKSFYAIALKLHEIDTTLLTASGDQLDKDLRHRYGADGSAAKWRSAFNDQEVYLTSWVANLDSQAKRRWFEQSLAVRTQVAQSLMEAYVHMEDLRHDVGFLQGATAASELLPRFALEDAETELLTTGNAAEKARILAESASGFSLPPALESLDGPTVFAPTRSDGTPELSR